MESVADSPPGQSNVSAVFSDTTPLPPKFSEANGSAVAALPDCIPPDHPHRTLVLCFDGTGDQFDADVRVTLPFEPNTSTLTGITIKNSNVVEFFSMLKKEDPSRQLAGIGTYTTPEIASPTFAKFSKLLDEMIAWNLDSHIMGGYEFLMQNYRSNDKICIFGFSRGAYTARCLAGMIHKVGLLPTCNHQQVPFAYKMYTRTDDVGWKQSNAFKKTFSIDVDIEFLGVWDTVNSVGLIPRRLPFTTSNVVVHTFRHAVSLDERRGKFKANLWNRPSDHEQMLSISDQKAKQLHEHVGAASHKRQTPSLRALERRYSLDRNIETDVDEVWFAGCHCDVGGGSVENGVAPCLARIPLRWMVRECFKTNTGILFHTNGLRAIGLDPASLYPFVLPRPPAVDLDTSKPEMSVIQSIPKVPHPPVSDDVVGAVVDSEEVADLKDVLSPIYDQLSLHWFWWLLELLPLRHRVQKDDSASWMWKFGWNMGGGRCIPQHKAQHLRVHRSVKTRMAAEDVHGRKYTPKAFRQNADDKHPYLDLKHVTWVD